MFEITESMVMADLSGARDVMKRLSQLGVRLAIDDFGTGHSSLAYLKQFPVQEVKVDRTFVQGVANSPVDSAIVRAIIDLASAMGISAMAEGVETKDQVTGLKQLGCEVGARVLLLAATHRSRLRRVAHPAFPCPGPAGLRVALPAGMLRLGNVPVITPALASSSRTATGRFVPGEVRYDC